jgi:O-antigen ligase
MRLGGTPKVSWGAAVTALSVPLIFLHVRWQPGIGVRFGQTTLNAYLSDFAVLAIAVAAIVKGRRAGFGPLKAARWLWVACACFLIWVAVEVAYGRHASSGYPWHTHAATAAKFAEYALLAPSLPLLLRNGRDLVAFLWSFTLWSVVATSVGIAQFLGASIFVFGSVGGRQGSFLSEADFAALSGAVLIAGLVWLLVARLRLTRSLGAVAVVSGLLGLILAAAVASLVGLALAAGAIAILLQRRGELPVRRALAASVVALVAVGGVMALRGGDVSSFAHFLRSSHGSAQAQQKTVQTYSHRTLLAWIGYQIWKDHPILGNGWEASGDPGTFERYLPAAHTRFPNEPAAAFPSAAHAYGVQNAWVQALADLGVVGLVLFLGMFVTCGATAWRAARAMPNFPALIGLGWTGLLVGLWTAQSFVAGIPLDAVTWLGFGLVATGAGWAHARA